MTAAASPALALNGDNNAQKSHQARQATPPAAPQPPSGGRRSSGRTERASLAVLVLGLHLGGLATMVYFGAKVTIPPQITPIQVAFIPLEAPPQPEPAPPAPPVKVEKPTPPKPVPPKVEPKPRPKPVAREPEPTTTSESAISAEKHEPTPPAPPQAPPAPPAPPAPTPPAPVTAARFDADYLNNPAPSYPPLSRRMREEGRVMLRVLVSPEGLPAKIELSKSSGSERLDNAARDAVTRWRFVAAKQGDQPIEAWVLVPIVFNLEGK
ncbi:TonB family protein [Azoarcus sp. TTM-91]|uniref:energy transducer TonB n=1 Tax=Azoarcus sp. TTM-91 TaxID=2691581 RepID=UPI00145C8DAD|nr:energy transducer TonB [Azoarcus sp. TTM-91]NMG36238.1 TonB family protein [Azoarcus sp. TTM-91]